MHTIRQEVSDRQTGKWPIKVVFVWFYTCTLGVFGLSEIVYTAIDWCAKNLTKGQTEITKCVHIL